MDLTLSSIRMFVAVVEDGSFTRAAGRLHTTQSAVSQQVRKLEDRYGATLLTRSRAGTVPTPAGERLYRHGVAILQASAAAEADLRHAGGHGLEGEARIGLMSAMTRCLMGPALRDFRQANPNARIDVVEEVSNGLVAGVLRDELDVAVVPVLEVPASVACRSLGATPEVFVSRRDPARHLQPVDLARESELRLILPGEGNLRRQHILAYLAARGITAGEAMTLGSMFGTLEYIRNSDHGTILPAMMVAPELTSMELCVRPLAVRPLALELMSLSPRRRAPSPLAGAFIRRLEAELAAFHAQLPGAVRAG